MEESSAESTLAWLGRGIGSIKLKCQFCIEPATNTLTRRTFRSRPARPNILTARRSRVAPTVSVLGFLTNARRYWLQLIQHRRGQRQEDCSAFVSLIHERRVCSSRYDANEILPAHTIQSGLHNRQCQDPVICAIRLFDKDRYVLQSIQGGVKHDCRVVLMRSAVANRLVSVFHIPCRRR
jgi:hypothetical protein